MEKEKPILDESTLKSARTRAESILKLPKNERRSREKKLASQVIELIDWIEYWSSYIDCETYNKNIIDRDLQHILSKVNQIQKRNHRYSDGYFNRGKKNKGKYTYEVEFTPAKNKRKKPVKKFAGEEIIYGKIDDDDLDLDS